VPPNGAEGRDSILSHGEDEMAYADRIGKRVVIERIEGTHLVVRAVERETNKEG
jgi:membrane protein implicated in regulation of membrane protease activity